MIAATEHQLKPPPFRHQQTGTPLLQNHPYFALFDDAGTGKSRIVVDAMCALHENGKINLVIVVCPNTVKGNWADPSWGQIALYTPDRISHTVIRFNGNQEPLSPELTWVVINYEAIRSEKVLRYLMDLARQRSTALVLDESSRAKNRLAQQTKACLRLGQVAHRRYILSGTPVANNPLDIYAQFYFLDPSILSFSNYFAFRARYAVMGGYRVFGRPVEIIGWKNLDELERKIAPYSRRVLKEDCLDLPEKIRTTRTVELTKEQWAAYGPMRKEMIAYLKDKTAAATTALTKLLRLTQITAGYLPAEGVIHRFTPNPKLEALREILQETREKVIVWCVFIEEIKAVGQLLDSMGIGHVEVWSEVTGEDRDLAIQNFQQDPQTRVFIGQVATGGLGITLTAAGHVVYMTNSYSWEYRSQSEDRAHRAGQTKNVTYIDLLAVTPRGGRTVDHKVLTALLQKKNLADSILGQLEDF